MTINKGKKMHELLIDYEFCKKGTQNMEKVNSNNIEHSIIYFSF